MDVRIVEFPETKVASITHLGSPRDEQATVLKLVSWNLERGLRDPAKNRSYGLHYTDARESPPNLHRVDFCLSLEDDVGPNEHGIVQRVIPGMRCARARDVVSKVLKPKKEVRYDDGGIQSWRSRTESVVRGDCRA